jgi:predicted O-methyltransferase YrrM
MQSEEVKECWYIGLDLLLKGDELAAQDVWMSAFMQGTLENVEDWTRELVKLLELNSIEQLQVGNFLNAKKCYLIAQEISPNYKNDVLESILLWQERYTHQCVVKGYQFTMDWFSHNILVWNQVLKKFAHLPNLAFLEIGSWEGRSTCWMLDNILTHESSKITCIDTFEGSVEHEGLDKEFLNSIESTFDLNISKTNRIKQVEKCIGISQEVLRQFSANTYDFLYIDGSHMAPDVLEDALLGWRLIKVGGIIIFDDYEWQAHPPTHDPKLAVDAFLSVFRDKIKLLYKGYQVVIEKTDL